MKKYEETDLQLAEEAAGWLLRLEHEWTEECEREFSVWIRCPRHVEAFLVISAIYKELDGLDPQRRIDLTELLRRVPRRITPLVSEQSPPDGKPVWIPSLAAERPAAREKRRSRLLGLAAALGILAIGVPSAHDLSRGVLPQRYATAIGENRAITLEDGSVIHLNTDSRVTVRFSKEARDVELLEGEAIFLVHHDPERPFRVHTNGVIVRAVGTEFDVRRHPDHTSVTVISGVVEVSRPPAESAPIRLAATETVRIPHGAQPRAADVVQLSPAELGAAHSWTRGFLQFHQQTLAEAVAEINRYNRQQIRIEDPEIAGVRIGGTYRATDPQGFALSVSRILDIDIVGAWTAPSRDIQLRRKKGLPDTPEKATSLISN